MLASIDVGSNTVRLLLGSVDKGQVVPSEYVREITRLKGGQNVAGLAPDAIARTVQALSDFAAVISRHNPDSIRVVGTEALRSAANSSEFVNEVKNATGLHLEVIGGTEEASLTAKGVCSVLKQPTEAVLVFDIGGGSTEFVLVKSGKILYSQSYQLGVVDLTERLPTSERGAFIRSIIKQLRTSIEPVLQQRKLSMEDLTLVGTAGTATTLAALDMEMQRYDWRRVNGYCLPELTIRNLLYKLDRLTVDEREQLPGMEKGRGDLIPSGIQIILEIMSQFQSKKLMVSDFGLLEGILLSMAQIGSANH